MMHDWKIEFGTGFEKIMKETTRRGRIGRARRKAKNIVHTHITRGAEKEAVAEARTKKQDASAERQDLAAEHWQAERIRLKRDRELEKRASRR